jgi:WD40 repeat protein
MADVFISYAREDQAFVRTQASALIASGRQVWVDFEGIPPTADWMREIRRAVEAACVFVSVISEHWLASEVCRVEAEYARQMRKRMVEVTPATADPSSVISSELTRDEAWLRAHTRLLVRAMEWETRGRDSSLLLRGTELERSEADLARQARDPDATAVQAQYVLASRQAASRRQRGLLAISIAVIVIVALLGVFAIVQRSRAIDRAHLAESRGLAAASASAEDPQLALLLALEAWRSKPTFDAEQAVRQAVVNARPSGDDELLFRASDKRVGALDFTADSARLAVGDGDGQVRIIDVANGASIDVDRVQHHVNALDFSADDRYLLVAAATVRLYDLRDGVVRVDLPGTHTAAAFAPDGKLFVAGTPDGWIYTVDRTTGTVRDRWEQLRPPVRSIAFESNGSRFVAGGGFGVRVFDAADPSAKPLNFEGHSGLVETVAFSPDGKLIASGGDDLRIRVWDVESQKTVQTFSDTSAPYGLQFAPNGRQLVSIGVNGTPVVWFLGEHPMRVQLRPRRDNGTSIAIAPDGERIAVGRFPGTVSVFRCEVCGSMNDVLDLARKRTTRQLTAEERAKYAING